MVTPSAGSWHDETGPVGAAIEQAHRATIAKACDTIAMKAAKRAARVGTFTRRERYHGAAEARQWPSTQAAELLRRFLSAYIARSASSTATRISIPPPNGAAPMLALRPASSMACPMASRRP